MRERDVDHVVVVVPARDEEDTVGDAVAGVLRSATVLQLDAPRVRVDLVVVANGCSDGTAARARAAGAVVVLLGEANVGRARGAGAQWALDRGTSASRLWIATTDADSVVPPGWLGAHLAASTLADVFVGTIELAVADRARHVAWVGDYAEVLAAGVRQPGEPDGQGAGHGHVHGASLGVRGSSYVAAGGFADLRAHEDVDLLARLVATGAVVARDAGVPVLTSARHDSRVVEGVGPDLAASVATSVPSTDPPPSRP